MGLQLISLMTDNILPIIQVRSEYVTQMHNTVRIVQLGVVKDVYLP